MNAWIWLLLAAACEITWAIALKKSDNFARHGWSAAAIIFMLLSFVLLARAMKSLPVARPMPYGRAWGPLARPSSASSGWGTRARRGAWSAWRLCWRVWWA